MLFYDIMRADFQRNDEMRVMDMPKVGARMVKSATAVFLCFLIYLIRGAGIPFYSAIAAVLCTQPELDDAKAKGKSRIIATLLGGVMGMLMLFLFQTYLRVDQELLRLSLISLMIVPLIYLTILIKQPSSSYLTCVVFMCITVSHAGDSDPFFFALNRIVDTLIGIFVALAVNAVHLPHKKHREILIEIPFSYLIEDDKTISTYTKVHLNRMIKEGANLMIRTSSTPSALLRQIQGLKEPISYVLMDGVLRYERSTQCCMALHTIPYATWSKLYHIFGKMKYAPFIYEAHDDLLYIHHEPYYKKEDEIFYKVSHKLQGQCFVNHECAVSTQYHQEIIMMMLLIETEQTVNVEQHLSDFIHELTWVLYEHPFDPNYKCLHIYPGAIAIDDPATLIQNEIGASSLYKVRQQGELTSKQVIKEIQRVFHHGS